VTRPSGMLLAVDPGDEHVGVAWFDKQEKGWGCVLVLEMTPGEFRGYLGPALASGIFRYFVVESWALYREKALQLIGSEMLTSQMIGMAKYVHWVASHGYEIDLVMQKPSVKKATFAILARKGYQFAADRLKIPAQHVRDAEVHGVYFIKQTLEEKVVLSSELWDEPPS
jgi:hypothetical protein